MRKTRQAVARDNSVVLSVAACNGQGTAQLDKAKADAAKLANAAKLEALGNEVCISNH